MTSAAPLLELVGAGRSFPGAIALADVSLTFRAGEVHALVGENGAGKSTLINIISGVLRPSEGELRHDGRPILLNDPIAARRLGIVTVHQEAELFATLSIAENLALGQGLPTSQLGWIDWRKVYKQAAAAVAVLHEPLDARRSAAALSVAQRQMLQIAHAIAQKARLVVLDEPTNALSGAESEWLFAHIRRLTSSGVGVVYVSHRQKEIFALADRITVLRDGRKVWTRPKSEVTRPALVQAMIGREYQLRADSLKGKLGPPRLQIRQFSDDEGRCRDVALTVHAGEVVGLYGLIGAGRTDFARALFGMKKWTGEAMIDSRPYHGASPGAATKAGIAYLPEDRLTDGVCRGLAVKNNLVLASLAKWSVGPFVRPLAETKAARDQSAALGVRCRSIHQPIGELSGGNQQKVVLGRWLLCQPKVLLLDEPTRGVDVRAKSELYALIRETATKGAAVVLISSELEEVLAFSDRVIVFQSGRIAGEFPASAEQANAIAQAALPPDSPVEAGLAEAKLAERPREPERTEQGFRRPSATIGLAAAVGALATTLAATTEAFSTSANLLGVVGEASLWLLLGLAAATVIIAGGIDISIGALAALSAGVAAAVMKAPLPPPLVVPAGVAAGLAVGFGCGGFNAALSLLGRVHPIVVSLGMMTVYRGMLRLLFAGGGWTMLGDLSPGFRGLALNECFGVSGSLLLALTSALVCHVWFTRTASGRHLFALGGSPTAARLAGISANRVWWTAFSVGGALAGAAGMLELARNGSMQATLGEGYELRGITAAVVGGAAVAGGRGSVAGVVLGTLLLSLIHNALILWRVPGIFYELVVGALLLAAVLLDVLARRKQQ